MSVTVKKTTVNGGINVYARVQAENIKNAVYAAGDQVLARSRITAPKDTKQMVNSATVKRNGTQAIIEYGNSDTGYAKIQEEKRFSHYTTPNTGPHFLEKAGESVEKQGGVNFFLKKS